MTFSLAMTSSTRSRTPISAPSADKFKQRAAPLPRTQRRPENGPWSMTLLAVLAFATTRVVRVLSAHDAPAHSHGRRPNSTDAWNRVTAMRCPFPSRVSARARRVATVSGVIRDLRLEGRDPFARGAKSLASSQTSSSESVSRPSRRSCHRTALAYCFAVAQVISPDDTRSAM